MAKKKGYYRGAQTTTKTVPASEADTEPGVRVTQKVAKCEKCGDRGKISIGPRQWQRCSCKEPQA